MSAYPQQGVPVAYAQPQQQQQQAIVIQQNNGPDGCYLCCCPPCAIMSVEGCSPMAIVCWAACLLGFWPFNGFCALCYEPQSQQTTVVQQQQAPQPGYVPAVPSAYPNQAPAPAYGAPPPQGAYPQACAPAPGPPVGPPVGAPAPAV